MRGRVVSLQEIFESIAGQRIPGGCDDGNVYLIEISHDDTCPFLQRWASREAH